MPAADPAAYLPLAERLADAAGAVTRRHFRAAITIETKADATPVTIADREAESAMRTILAETVPDHGILGEEHGTERADAEFVWVLDPIDGTKSYATGRPLFGTLIALTRGGVPVLGVIDQPIIGERWTAADGVPTRFNGAPARVRPCAELAHAWLYSTSPFMFEGADFDRFTALRTGCRHDLYGGDCYSYGLVASGHADLVVETGLKAVDFCALVPVVTGAGGIMTDWQGNPLGIRSPGQAIAAGDARIHAKAREILNG